MSTTLNGTPKPGRQSLFFQDLSSPVSARSGKFSTPGQTAAVSALRRENFGVSDLPPPPMFTLEDRSDFSPGSGIADYPMSPEIKSDSRTSVHNTPRNDFSSHVKSKIEASTSYAFKGGQLGQQGSVATSWWSTSRSGGEQEDKGKSSPVDGIVQPGALITIPPPREVARPEAQRNCMPVGNIDEEEWVTVYGFSPGDTNSVLYEFEKCGVIVKHVLGPREANWMHILYQNRSDAQKALNKSGIQINGIVIIGVKPVDPTQLQALNKTLNHRQVFTPLPPPASARFPELNPSRPSQLPHYINSANQSGSATIACPSKSIASKVMDLMFGV